MMLTIIYLINFYLIWIPIINSEISMYYSRSKDMSPIQSGTVLEYYFHNVSGKWPCLRRCYEIMNCSTVVYRAGDESCYFMLEYQNELTLDSDPGVNVYSKRPCRQITRYSRSDWGAADPINYGMEPFNPPVSYVVVHHMALSRSDLFPGDCGTQPQCAQAVRDVQYYDTYTRSSPWSDIAENFFLDGSGNWYTGRGWNYAAGYTSIVSRGGVSGYGMHVAVALLGDFRFNTPNTAMKLSLRAFCACAIEEGNLTPSYTVLGHVVDKPFSSYICPGQAMLDMIDKWPLIFD